jgi:hypothetical protein
MDFNQYDNKHYKFARTSREAYGYELKDADFDADVPHNGDRAVAIGCIIIILLIAFGLVG